MDALTALASGRPYNPLASGKSVALQAVAKANRPKKPKKETTEADREAERGIIQDLGANALSALGYIGGSLDKAFGGRAIRTVLSKAGSAASGTPDRSHWRDVASVVPFSDALGITKPEHDVSGRDVLEHAGILAKNKPGLDAGDVAGLGAEILLDPGSFLTGPTKALSKGGQALSKMGVLKHAAKIATERAAPKAATIGAKGGADVAAAFAKKPLGWRDVGQKVAEAVRGAGDQVGIREAHQILTPRQLMERLPKPAQEHQKFIKQFANEAEATKHLDTPIGGLTGWGLPFMQPSIIKGQGGLAQKIARQMDRPGLAWANSPLGRQTAALFERAVVGTTTKNAQESMRHGDELLKTAQEAAARHAAKWRTQFEREIAPELKKKGWTDDRIHEAHRASMELVGPGLHKTATVLRTPQMAVAANFGADLPQHLQNKVAKGIAAYRKSSARLLEAHRKSGAPVSDYEALMKADREVLDFGEEVKKRLKGGGSGNKVVPTITELTDEERSHLRQMGHSNSKIKGMDPDTARHEILADIKEHFAHPANGAYHGEAYVHRQFTPLKGEPGDLNIPTHITPYVKRVLESKRFTDEQIGSMSPQEAFAVIGGSREPYYGSKRSEAAAKAVSTDSSTRKARNEYGRGLGPANGHRGGTATMNDLARDPDVSGPNARLPLSLAEGQQGATAGEKILHDYLGHTAEHEADRLAIQAKAEKARKLTKAIEKAATPEAKVAAKAEAQAAQLTRREAHRLDYYNRKYLQSEQLADWAAGLDPARAAHTKEAPWTKPLPPQKPAKVPPAGGTATGAKPVEPPQHYAVPESAYHPGHAYFANEPISDVLHGHQASLKSRHAAQAIIHTLAKSFTEAPPSEVAPGAHQGHQWPTLKVALEKLGMDQDESVNRIIEALDSSGRKLPPEVIERLSDPETVHQQFENLLHWKVDPADVETLAKHQGFGTPGELHWAIQKWDRFTNLVKGHLTSGWPGFHARNILGGLVNEASETSDVAKSASAVSAAYKMMAGKAPQGLSEVAAFKGKGLTDEQAYRKVAEGFFASGLVRGAQGEAGDLVGDVAHLEKRDILKDIVGQQPVAPTPASVGKVMLGDIKRAASKGSWASRLKDSILGLRGAYGNQSGAQLLNVEWGNSAADYSENLMRMSTAIRNLMEGSSLDTAIQASKDMHVDYSELSQFEKNVMRRIVPFYSYSRRAIPHALKDIVGRPSGLRAQFAKTEYRQTRGDVVPKQVVGALPISAEDEKGNRRFLRMDLPFQTLNDLATIRPTALGTIKASALGAASMLHPLIKGPAELATGVSFFQRGRPLTDLYTGGPFTTSSPLVNQVVANSPLSRYQSTANMIADMRKGPGTKLFNLTSGLRLSDIDVKKERATAIRDLTAEMLRGAPGVRVATDVYVPKGEEGKLTPRTKAILEMVNRQKLEAARAKRELDKKAKK